MRCTPTHPQPGSVVRLTCPRCGPAFGLILLAERVDARRVVAASVAEGMTQLLVAEFEEAVARLDEVRGA